MQNTINHDRLCSVGAGKGGTDVSQCLSLKDFTNFLNSGLLIGISNYYYFDDKLLGMLVILPKK